MLLIMNVKLTHWKGSFEQGIRIIKRSTNGMTVCWDFSPPNTVNYSERCFSWLFFLEKEKFIIKSMRKKRTQKKVSDKTVVSTACGHGGRRPGRRSRAPRPTGYRVPPPPARPVPPARAGSGGGTGGGLFVTQKIICRSNLFDYHNAKRIWMSLSAEGL